MQPLTIGYPDFKETQTELKSKEFLSSKFFKSRAEEPFFAEIAPQLQKKRVKTEVFDTAIIQTPNNAALQNICSHYQNKYQIQIELVESSGFASLCLKLKTSADRPYFMGIIVRENGEKPYGHVTPVLCYFAPGQEDYYNMDVLGGDSLIEGCAIKGAKGKRQVDTDSCRIGAVTLLRNALLWIKRNGAKEDTLRTILERLKVDQTEFGVPLEWSYTEQIYPKNIDLSGMYAIRDYYSKKKKEPRTIEQFREENNKPATFNCTLFLPKVTLSAPSDIEITYLSKEVVIAYSVTLPKVNRYLQEKGIFEMTRKELIS